MFAAESVKFLVFCDEDSKDLGFQIFNRGGRLRTHLLLQINEDLSMFIIAAEGTRTFVFHPTQDWAIWSQQITYAFMIAACSNWDFVVIFTSISYFFLSFGFQWSQKPWKLNLSLIFETHAFQVFF